MPLKATSGSATASVGVSSAKIRATIDVAMLQAGVSSEVATAQIAYQHSAATGIYVDPDTKNRTFGGDIVPLEDVHFTLITKPLFDEAKLVEYFSNNFGLTKEDAFGVIENFSKVIHFRRNFEHAFTLDDSSLIDKDYYGNKGNIFGLDELYTSSLGKGVSDDFSLGEEFVRAVQFYREFSHSVEFTELYSADVQKGITDTLDGIEDTLGINVDKNISELLGFDAQDYHQAMLTAWDSQNYPVINQEALDTLFIKIDEGTPEERYLGDLYTVTGTGYSDYGVTTSRIIVNGYIQSGAEWSLFNSNPEYLERLYRLLEAKTNSRAVFIEDTTSLQSSLIKSDTISTINDISTLGLGLGKEDDFAFTDNALRTFTKVLSDGFALDDATLVNKDYTGTKGNIFGLDEVFVRSVQYQRLFNTDTIGFSEEQSLASSLGKSDSFNFAEDFTRSMGFNRNIESRFTALDFENTMKELYDGLPYTNIECAQLLHTLTPEGAYLGDLLYGSVPPNADSIGLSFVVLRYYRLGGVQLLYDQGLTNVPDILARVYALLNAGAELALLTDTTSLQASLGKNDSIDDITEVISRSTSLGKDNDFSLTEDFSRVNIYNRAISDGFFLDDATLVDKNYSGNKTNLFGFTEEFKRALVYNRDFTTDTVGFEENLGLDATLDKSDSFNFTEDFSRTADFNRDFANDTFSLDSIPELSLGKSILSKYPTVTFNNLVDVSGTSGLSQSNSRLATLQNGNIVIVWVKDLTGTPTLVMSLYSADKAIIVEQVVIDSDLSITAVGFDVAALSGGGFVVTWLSDTGISAKSLSADGADVAVFDVASGLTTPEVLKRPVVCGLPNDSFAVAWTYFDGASTDVHARVLGVGANAYDYTSFVVNEDYLIFDQANPSITALVGGGFVVLFNGHEEGSSFSLVSTVYDDVGTRVYGPLRFGVAVTYPYTGDYLVYADVRSTDVAALQNGGFVVIGKELSGNTCHFQVYDSSAVALGSTVRIAENINSIKDVCVVGLLGGGFAIAWENADSVKTIETQRFNDVGVPVTPIMLASSGLSTTQEHPSITYSGDDYIVAWDNSDSVSLRDVNELSTISVETENELQILNARMDWYDPTGVNVTEPPNNDGVIVSLVGSFVIPSSLEGSCIVTLSTLNTMFDSVPTFHDIVATVSGGVISITLLYDWADNLNIPVTLDVALTTNADGTSTFVTLDTDGDGILGYPMTGGPFIGFSIGISGQLSGIVAHSEQRLELISLEDVIDIEVFSGISLVGNSQLNTVTLG